jgi:F-box protein 11
MPNEESFVGFLSYLTRADKFEKGRISLLRERLEEEVQLQLGVDFHIFQDRRDVSWGQNWKRRISEAVGGVMLFFPVLTPGFFQSSECRQELQQFLEYEKQRGRDDLILPIHYIEVPELTEPAEHERDELVERLLSRQIVDWRELRHEPHTSPVVGRTLEWMAKQVRAAVRRGKPVSGSVTAVRTTAGGTSEARASVSSTEEKPSSTEPPVPEERRHPATQNTPETLVVDAWGRKGSRSLAETIRKASAGARILILPGDYDEALVIDKPLELLGEGNREDIVIRARNAHVISFKTNMGRVANLTLLQAGGAQWSTVDITQGRLELEDCDISSKSLSCVRIRDGADPRLRRNRIHDGNTSGVFVYTNGLGTLEDNDIWGNAYSGVEIKEGGNPTLRRNRIRDGRTCGVLVHTNGLGTLEDNDISGNELSGVIIKEGGNPMLRRNRIHSGKQNGVFIHTNGLGTLEDNDISGNAYAGVGIKEGGNPTLRRNRIYKNKYEAIWIYSGGRGVMEDNDLRDNERGAWDIDAACIPNVKRARNQE